MCSNCACQRTEGQHDLSVMGKWAVLPYQPPAPSVVVISLSSPYSLSSKISAYYGNKLVNVSGSWAQKQSTFTIKRGNVQRPKMAAAFQPSVPDLRQLLFSPRLLKHFHFPLLNPQDIFPAEKFLWISPFWVSIIRYLRLSIFENKDFYLAHGLEVQGCGAPISQTLTADFMVDGITVQECSQEGEVARWEGRVGRAQSQENYLNPL